MCLRRDNKFLEKGGDVATVAMHVAEVSRCADLLRRGVMPSRVQMWFAKKLRRNTDIGYRVTIQGQSKPVKQVKLSERADKSIVTALLMSSAA